MNNQPIEWSGDRVRILDQTLLPQKEVYLELTSYLDMAAASKERDDEYRRQSGRKTK